MGVEHEASIFVVGGLDAQGVGTSTVDELTTNHSDSHQFAGRHHEWFARNPLGRTRYGAPVVLFGERLYVIGGASGGAGGDVAVHVVEFAGRSTDPGPPFTDDPLVARATIIKAAHVTELRTAIDALRVARGLPGFAWTDPVLTARATAFRAVHLADLWTALQEAFTASGLSPPHRTSVTARSTVILEMHVARLRAAVVALRTHQP